MPKATPPTRRAAPAAADPAPQLALRLYVAGGAANSMRAIANLEALQHAHLVLRGRVEIVDVFREPERAVQDTVLLTPMLVKQTPGLPVRIVGDLSDTRTVLATLGVAGL